MNQQLQVANSANAQHQSKKNGFIAAQSQVLQTGPPAPTTTPGPAPPPTSVSSSQNGPTVQTIGANGTTSAYAQSITDTAKQSLASGTITQAEYDSIVALANQGHEIATIQGLLENAYTQSSGNSNTFANTQLTFNGQNYTPAQLNSVLQSTVGTFSTMKSQVSVLNGVLTDQKLLTTVNNSGTQIINNGYATQQQNQSSASFIQYQSTGASGGGSTDTNQQSANICTAGQHLDANNHCVP